MYDALDVSPTTYWVKQFATTALFTLVFVFLTPVSFISFVSSANPQLSVAGLLELLVRGVRAAARHILSLRGLYDILPPATLPRCVRRMAAVRRRAPRAVDGAALHVLGARGEHHAQVARVPHLQHARAAVPRAHVARRVPRGVVRGRTRHGHVSLLGRVFLTSSGAFSVCFVATQTWVGAAMDVARISERAYGWARRALAGRAHQASQAVVVPAAAGGGAGAQRPGRRRRPRRRRYQYRGPPRRDRAAPTQSASSSTSTPRRATRRRSRCSPSAWCFPCSCR